MYIEWIYNALYYYVHICTSDPTSNMIRCKVKRGTCGHTGKMLDTQAPSQSCTSDHVQASSIQDKLNKYLLL
jgi:hypothetical protein